MSDFTSKLSFEEKYLCVALILSIYSVGSSVETEYCRIFHRTDEWMQAYVNIAIRKPFCLWRDSVYIFAPWHSSQKSTCYPAIAIISKWLRSWMPWWRINETCQESKHRLHGLEYPWCINRVGRGREKKKH